MKKFVIIALLLAPFVYGYYHKPQLDRHREKIWAAAKGEDAAFDQAAAELPQWDDLYLVDWLVFTGTRDKKLETIVSFGLFDHVFVIDSDWAPQTFKLSKEKPS